MRKVGIQKIKFFCEASILVICPKLQSHLSDLGKMDLTLYHSRPISLMIQDQYIKTQRSKYYFCNKFTVFILWAKLIVIVQYRCSLVKSVTSPTMQLLENETCPFSVDSRQLWTDFSLSFHHRAEDFKNNEFLLQVRIIWWQLGWLFPLVEFEYYT